MAKGDITVRQQQQSVVVQSGSDGITVSTDPNAVQLDNSSTAVISDKSTETIQVKTPGSEINLSDNRQNIELTNQGGQGPPGLQGPAGPAGPQGEPGPAGANTFGWAFLRDGAFTETNRLEIQANSPTHLPIENDPAVSFSNLSPVLAGHDFLSQGNFVPFNQGDAYLLRLNFDGVPLQIGGRIRLEADIQSPNGPIFSKSENIAFDAGERGAFSFVVPIFSGAIFPPEGARFILSSDVVLEIFNIDLFVIPTYIEI